MDPSPTHIEPPTQQNNGERRGSRLLAVIPSPSHQPDTNAEFKLRSKTGQTTKNGGRRGRKTTEQQEEVMKFSDDDDEPYPVSFRERFTRKFRKSRGSSSSSQSSDKRSSGRGKKAKSKGKKNQSAPADDGLPPSLAEDGLPTPAEESPPPLPADVPSPPTQMAAEERRRRMMPRQERNVTELSEPPDWDEQEPESVSPVQTATPSRRSMMPRQERNVLESTEPPDWEEQEPEPASAQPVTPSRRSMMSAARQERNVRETSEPPVLDEQDESEGHDLPPPEPTTDQLASSDELDIDPEDEFRFLPPGDEPVLSRSFQKRADKAVKRAALQVFKEEKEEKEPSKCCAACREVYQPVVQAKEEIERRIKAELPSFTKPKKDQDKQSISSLTPQLKKASSMGFDMMKSVMFPAMPQLLQDLWVFMEFTVTVLSFILAMVGLDLSENKVLNIVALILSIIGIILALIDGYIYFFQVSHFFKTFSTCLAKVFHSKCKTTSQGDKEDGQGEGTTEVSTDEVEEERGKRKWWQLSDKAKEILDTWFEVGRTVISEIILYPTLVCDLLDFVSGVTEVADDLKEDPTNQLDFTLFLLGNLYTIIAVYFMRLLVVVGMFVQIRKMPTLSSGSPKGYMAILGRFCLHVTSQIVCHAMIALALSAKIHQENPGDQDSLVVSPFMWIMIVTGGIIPLAGIAVFFLTNYYWMREFSVSFWLDMISMLQGESFAEVVFGGDSTNVAKEKSETLAEKTEFSVVKTQFKLYKNSSFLIKATYPLRLPLLVVLGLLYDFVVISFIVSMAFSTDSDTGDITFVLFDQSFLAVMFFLILVCLLVANYQVLILINLWLVCVTVVAILMLVVGAIIAPLVIVFYFPYCMLGTCLHTLLPKLF